MKPLLEDIGKKRGDHSFLAFELKKNRLEFYWHYHPEYELTYIINGKGRRLIGDHIFTFRDVKDKVVFQDSVVQEIRDSTISERGARIDDKRSEAAMEKRKQQGYF